MKAAPSVVETRCRTCTKNLYLDICLIILLAMSTQSLFKALADPTRREILSQLRAGSLTAGELAEVFTITKASLSHHFNLLKQADLVRTERRGQHIVYSLNTTVLQDAASLLLDLVQTEPEPKELTDDV